MKFEAIQKGDVLPADMPEPLLRSGADRWFGILVNPQSESKAKAWIEANMPGSKAFYPVTKARRPQRRGKSSWVEYERRYLPGYVFARVPGVPVWHRLFNACPFIRDAVRHNSGDPAVIAPASLERIYAMRSIDADNRAREKRARTIRRGDRVSFDFGGTAYSDIEVVEISGPFGVVKLTILGASEIKVPLAGMAKA